MLLERLQFGIEVSLTPTSIVSIISYVGCFYEDVVVFVRVCIRYYLQSDAHAQMILLHE